MKRTTVLRVRAALAALGACALAAPALAGDVAGTPVAGAHQSGYPRSSDEAPVPLATAPTGWGGANTGATGTVYDTNWITTASPNDGDTVYLKVREASVAGTGQASDSDADSATRHVKSAWGEDRLRFHVDAPAAASVKIRVTNHIRFVAVWVIGGAGRNSAVLDAEALDILGTTHAFRIVRDVEPDATGHTIDSTSDSTQESETGSDGSTGRSERRSSRRTTVDVSSEDHIDERTVTSADGDAGDSEGTADILLDVAGRDVDVRIASRERILVQAQTILDGVETTVDVTRFDTENWVEASYVVDADGDGGCGTPGGENGGGTGTPGGAGDGSGGPTTPGGGDGTTPPSGDDESGPEPAWDPHLDPRDGETPGEQGTEPSGGGGSVPSGGDDTAAGSGSGGDLGAGGTSASGGSAPTASGGSTPEPTGDGLDVPDGARIGGDRQGGTGTLGDSLLR